MNPPYDDDKAEGYYYAMNVEPWEGASVRIRRDGAWEEFTPLVENGKALFWLGKDEIIADAIEVRDADGVVTRYTLDIQGGPKPVAIKAKSATKVAAKKATKKES